MSSLTKEQRDTLDLDCDYFNLKEKTISECESNGHYLCKQCKNYTGDLFERRELDAQHEEYDNYEEILHHTVCELKYSKHCGNPDCNRPTRDCYLYLCNICGRKVCSDCYNNRVFGECDECFRWLQENFPKMKYWWSELE